MYIILQSNTAYNVYNFAVQRNLRMHIILSPPHIHSFDIECSVTFPL